MKLYIALVCALFLIVTGQSQSINQRQEDSLTNARNKQVIGKPLANFIAAGDDGLVNNDRLKGKVTYINMWESSCAPCMAEMGALNKLYDTLRENPNFQFISLSADKPETIRRIKEKYHIQYNIYHLDEEGCYQLNQGLGYPTSIILNEKSNVIYIHSGGDIDNGKIWRFIFSKEIYPAIVRETALIPPKIPKGALGLKAFLLSPDS